MKKITLKTSLSLLIVFILSTLIWANRSTYLSKTDIGNLKQKYQSSQYCIPEFISQHNFNKVSPNYEKVCEDHPYDGNIDDPDLYQLAGSLYVGGEDPAAINAESQPLTKYLFGISILTFGNASIAQLLIGILLLLLLYKNSKVALGGWVAYIPILLLALDPLYQEQLSIPHLDLGVALIAQIFLLLLYKWIKEDRNSMHLMVSLGLLALSKSFSIGIVASLVGLVSVIALDRGKALKYLKGLWIAAATYFAGYIPFFWHHQNPLDFVSLHLNTLRLYRSYVPEYPKFEVLRVITVGEWRLWYGDKGLVSVDYWWLAWPVALASSVFALVSGFFKKHSLVAIHLSWIFVYLGFTSIRLVFPRYLLPVLPSMYLVLTYTLKHIAIRKK